MKTKEGHLVQANIMLDKLNGEKPMLLYNILKAMQSYADQCVKARDEEIRKWIADNDLMNYISAEIAIKDIFQFLSTPSQVEPTQASTILRPEWEEANLSHQLPLLDEVKRLRDEYLLKSQNQKFQSIIYPIGHYYEQFTNSLNKIINNAKP